MELQVKVIEILEQRSYVSKKDGSTIVTNAFVGETGGQYPRKVKFDVTGEETFNKMGIMVGGVFSVSFDVSSREWCGKWYTNLNAWRAMKIDGAENSTVAQPEKAAAAPDTIPVPQAQPTPAPATNDGSEGLPF